MIVILKRYRFSLKKRKRKRSITFYNQKIGFRPSKRHNYASDFQNTSVLIIQDEFVSENDSQMRSEEFFKKWERFRYVVNLGIKIERKKQGVSFYTTTSINKPTKQLPHIYENFQIRLINMLVRLLIHGLSKIFRLFKARI